MFRSAMKRTAWAIAAVAVTVAAAQLLAQGPKATGQANASGAWTLDQALAHLQLYPRDAYVQYVALQLASRDNRIAEVATQIERGVGLADPRLGRRQDVDLFSIFSGSLAVQESLQLDTMLGDDVNRTRDPNFTPGRRVGPPPVGRDRLQERAPSDVPLAELKGPTVKSHPWHEMLVGRSPKVSLLARSVPDDFYLIEFRSVNKLLEASSLTDLWGRRLLNQSNQDAQTQLVNERLRQQLAVEDNAVLRPFYDSFVEGVAATGSDLFLREGSDVTLLFHVRQAGAFRAQMDQFLARAVQSRADAARTRDTYHGVDVDQVVTPDRQIHVFSAYPTPELHVRTNSRVALERILDAISGKSADGQPVVRLGDTDEFAYIRTLLPAGTKEEDGLIYLSDPFIRRLVGPELRLTEHRRLHCYNHLKMIGHAALMYRTEHGKNAASLAELTSAGCVTGEFGKGELVCPDGGQYSLAPDGLTGVCEHHGYANYLTPCCEIEVQRVTRSEADAYGRFVENYSRYWRTFFDPIAVRLTITPERYRAETIVLPLIDNSVYTGLARSLGGKPERLDALPVPQRNIFTVAVRFDKSELLRMAGMEELLREEQHGDPTQPGLVEMQKATDSLKQIDLALLNYESAHKAYPSAAKVDRDGKPLLSWRVEILPFLGTDEASLYRQFHLDEPWDSNHNRPLISKMPAVFRGSSEKLHAAGKTKFVSPRSANTVFPSDNQPIKLRQITDGLSATIAIVEVKDDDAVIWTKPEDVEADELLFRRLAIRQDAAFLAAFCDGSVHRLDKAIDAVSLAALFTRAQGDANNWQNFDRSPPPSRSHGPFGDFSEQAVRELQLGEFLAKGIGNQAAFHTYDAEPLVSFNLSQVLGLAAGTFQGRGGFDDDFLWVGMLIGALNSPVYMSVPVEDEKIVDGFLVRLDKLLNRVAHEDVNGGFFRVAQDYYQLTNGQEPAVRGYSIRFGPVKWRFFWQRIGKGLYVASKPEVLADLAAIQSQVIAEDAAGRPAHGMVRIRPQHWDRVLRDYRLGWAENNRQACLKNLGPLSSLSRALADGSKSITVETLHQYSDRLCDVHYFCPDGGEYVPAPDGTVTCSYHGSAHAPRQQKAPAKDAKLGGVLEDFSDATVSLVFLEDGLHAIVDLQRTQGSREKPN